MQMIIDIPDGYVKVVMANQRTEGTAIDKLLRQAVIDGEPLPKGHGRLGDLDRLSERIGQLKENQKVGHWVAVSDGYGDNAYICECSECNDTVWVYKGADRKWNYCPNCGVRMESD